MNARSLAVGLAALVLGPVAWGQNVDLSTVPPRERVQLTIYNSEDLTLVRETRVVSFKEGVNPLQFSWANTLIDPTSVELGFRSHGDALSVLDTTYPHDRPQSLYWNVRSARPLEAEIEISYFTSGISWSADYLAVAGAEGRSAELQAFVRVDNRSGEDYEQAQVRLVVGTINLVEKIARLARVPVEEVDRLQEARRQELRHRAARELMARDEVSELAAPARPKEVYKEGLSEYFIYTIEGTETVPSGWSKRLRSLHAGSVPIEEVYRYRRQEYGDRLVRLFIITNDRASGLGTTPLPDGTVRVFCDGGERGLRFLARVAVAYVPIGDELELNLGPDPGVLFELVKTRVWRDEIWMRLRRGKIYRRLDDDRYEIDLDATVAGWNDHARWRQRVANAGGGPVRLEIRRRLDGDVTFRSRLGATLHDYRTVEFTATLAAGEEATLAYEVVTRQGYNAKQSRVTLEAGAPGP